MSLNLNSEGQQSLSGNVDCARCWGLKLGQKKEFWEWKIPHAELITCSLKVIHTNGNWYVDFL